MKRNCNSCKGKGVSFHFETGARLPCVWCKGSGFDVSGSDNIVCPYCGEEHDHQEIEVYGEVDGVELECNTCEREFLVNGTLRQTFDTETLE